jgi:hypothetical protein
MGLVGWTNVITGLLLATAIGFTALTHIVFSRKHHTASRAFVSESEASSFFDSTLDRTNFILAIAIVVCGVLSLAGIGMELYNLIGVLVRCPVALPACANVTVNMTQFQEARAITGSIAGALVKQGYTLKDSTTLPISVALSGVYDPVFLNLMLYTMCTYEYGFMIFLVVFLFLVALLVIATMIYFLRLRYIAKR